MRDKKKALARLVAKQNQVRHQRPNLIQYRPNILGPESSASPDYKPSFIIDALEVTEDDDDIGSVIENMPVALKTMNTLKEILKLQKTEKYPNFNSETFQDSFPADIVAENDEPEEKEKEVFKIPSIL